MKKLTQNLLLTISGLSAIQIITFSLGLGTALSQSAETTKAATYKCSSLTQPPEQITMQQNTNTPGTANTPGTNTDVFQAMYRSSQTKFNAPTSITIQYQLGPQSITYTCRLTSS